LALADPSSSPLLKAPINAGHVFQISGGGEMIGMHMRIDDPFQRKTLGLDVPQ
jgi:hypothetical protein